MTDPKPRPQAISVSSDSHDLLKNPTAWSQLIKAGPLKPDAHSAQGTLKGSQPHLLDYSQASDLKNNNVHHSTCLEAKRDATVGLGHKNPKIREVLDPLCDVSWQDVKNNAIEDRGEFGNGYIEVVRNEAGQIRGLHHLPAGTVHTFVEGTANLYHFEITNQTTLTNTATLRWARFGDMEEFLARNAARGGNGLPNIDPLREVIHFPRPSNRSRHYGYIDWAAAVPSMELEACLTQFEFDFFFNGGVPDGLLTVTGKVMDKDDWDAIKDEFRKHIGLGNRRKVLLLNLGDPELEIKYDRLAADAPEANFKDFNDTLALKVVSAHRVPPLLAGIVIPGKLGAANELTNAMMAFQTLAISPSQKHISGILAATLGDPLVNGGLGLTADDFLGVGMGDPEIDPAGEASASGMPATRDKDNKGNGFNTILDEIDLGEMDTIGRMRESMAEAKFNERDLSEGVKERGDE